MSRIGKQPIMLKNVKAEVKDENICLKGPKGELTLTIPYDIKLNIEGDKIVLKREKDDKKTRSIHGTIRALLNNMVIGVSDGFKKELDIIGVGYKAQMKGKDLLLNVGFSHPVELAVPPSLILSTPKPTRIVVEGVDRQKVGEFAAKIRKIAPPEPYKGKGIRYFGEEVRKKLGKALAK